MKKRVFAQMTHSIARKYYPQESHCLERIGPVATPNLTVDLLSFWIWIHSTVSLCLLLHALSSPYHWYVQYYSLYRRHFISQLSAASLMFISLMIPHHDKCVLRLPLYSKSLLKNLPIQPWQHCQVISVQSTSCAARHCKKMCNNYIENDRLVTIMPGHC